MIGLRKILGAALLSTSLTALGAGVAAADTAHPMGSARYDCHAATFCSSNGSNGPWGTTGNGRVFVDVVLDNGNGLGSVSGTYCPPGGGLCGNCYTYQWDVPIRITFDCGINARAGGTFVSFVSFNGTGRSDVSIGWHQ